MSKRANPRRWQSGQSLVEVAIMLPFLLLIALGVIELGRFMYIGILVGNAARAGAAYATESVVAAVDTTGTTTAAQSDFANNGQNPTNLNVTSTVSCGCNSAGTITTAACTGVGAGTCASGAWVVTVTVTASGTFNSLFNYPGIPASITVSRAATMIVNQFG
jgi:Flp pilus assembly protein TadG